MKSLTMKIDVLKKWTFMFENRIKYDRFTWGCSNMSVDCKSSSEHCVWNLSDNLPKDAIW